MPTITQRVVRRARDNGVVILDRRQWGNTSPVYGLRRVTRRHKQLPSQPTDTLVQHITVTHDTGGTRDSFKADMRTLHAIGMSRFGTGVSYNFGWDMTSGMVGVGQSLDAAGAHTINEKGVPNYSENMNYTAIAVAAIGMPGDKPTEQAIAKLALLIASLIQEGALTRTFDYDPHSKFAAKDCPTDAVRDVMPQVRQLALDIVDSQEGEGAPKARRR